MAQTEQTKSDADERDALIAQRCPHSDLVMQGGRREPLAGYAELDSLRDAGPAHTLGTGQIIYTTYDLVQEVAQRADVFHSKFYDPVTGKEAAFTLVPHQIDGPVHVKWRRLLASSFSPGTVAGLEGSLRARVNEIIDGFIDRGHCDFAKEFALRFPTSIFLEHIIGLPVEELDKFIAWETDILHPESTDRAEAYRTSVRAQTEVTAYLSQILEERRKTPAEERGSDLISRAMDWQIDGEPIPHQELLSFYLLLFQAGLDTVTASLGYGFHHLASHPADRERIAADPSVVPNAIEEFLRVYSVVNIVRTAMTDTEVDGCPVKKGQRFILSLPSGNRDEQHFPDATTVDFDRTDISHLAFGAGPHRCLGSHLARQELVIAYEEWHKRIPVYEIDPDISFDESRSMLLGLNSLPLRWDPAAVRR
ncbi:cytochrome P450 [Streptomyces phaeochromogenes]|uniref:cytochrome P450 n=1 Tax=Streptomyces phaeochromogenes TaxID=1923 RepID=UPI00386C29EC|nr:cytochrome P450 [Streptomyces phaeochromogenes]